MPKTKKANRGRVASFPELENKLLEWVKTRRMAGVGVSTTDLRLKALVISRGMGSMLHNFKASVGWAQRFMLRHQLSVRRRTRIAQKMPSDFEEKLLHFQRFIITKRKLNNYSLSQIGNADQTPLTFDIPYTQTVDFKGEKTVTIKTTGNEKNRFTIMLAITGDGKKLPPYVVFKRKTFPKKETFPKQIEVRVHEKGWFDEAITKDWVKTIWEKRPGGLLKAKSLLVLDAFRCHRQPEIKNQLQRHNTDLAIIPGGMTSMLQPLDVSINKPFKALLCTKWNEWLAEGHKSLTLTGRVRKTTLSTICSWIIEAWDKIPEEMIVKSFKKCCITNALDGSEDDILFEEDISNTTTAHEECEDDQEILYADDVDYNLLASLFAPDSLDTEFFGFE